MECYRPLEYLGDGVLEQFTRSILVRNYPMLSSGCINVSLFASEMRRDQLKVLY